MIVYAEMSKLEQLKEQELVCRRFEKLRDRKLNLNMARGKPGKAQLDLVSEGLLHER